MADRIRVHIDGKEYSVVGGSFQEMLAAVKQVNGRRFVSRWKVWQLPGTVEEIGRQLDIGGYRLEGGTPVAETKAAPRPPAAGGDRIRLQVQGHRLAVVGGQFQDMLAVVKNLPGRRFDGETKTWEVPGEVGLIKGIIEAAGFELEGAENIPLEPVPPMEPPPGADEPPPPPPFEPPGFSVEDEPLPFEPPDWWDEEEMPPPSFGGEDDFPDFPDEPSPALPQAKPARRGEDRIRLRLGDKPLVVSGGSFQEMLAAVKEIPGRRFNGQEKVWEIPGDVSPESVQQVIQAAGFVLSQE